MRAKGSSAGRPVSSLWWSGVAAGISIGFSFLTQAAIAANLAHSDWTHVIASLGYSTGFIIVILGRQQLFTENVLTAVLPVMTHWKVSWLLKCFAFGHRACRKRGRLPCVRLRLRVSAHRERNHGFGARPRQKAHGEYAP